MKRKNQFPVYVMLDHGSSSTLVTPDVMNKLAIRGRLVKRHFLTIQGTCNLWIYSLMLLYFEIFVALFLANFVVQQCGQDNVSNIDKKITDLLKKNYVHG